MYLSFASRKRLKKRSALGQASPSCRHPSGVSGASVVSTDEMAQGTGESHSCSIAKAPISLPHQHLHAVIKDVIEQLREQVNQHIEQPTA